MNTYAIYDHLEKSLIYNRSTGSQEKGWRDMKVLTFKSKKAAETYKDEYLNFGNYYNRPHTVLEVIKGNYPVS